MLVEHFTPFEHVAGFPYERWIDELRNPAGLRIELSGHSIVFQHDDTLGVSEVRIEIDEDKQPADRRPLVQWLFGKPQITSMLLDLNKRSILPVIDHPVSTDGAEAPVTMDKGEKLISTDGAGELVELTKEVSDRASDAAVSGSAKPSEMASCEVSQSRRQSASDARVMRIMPVAGGRSSRGPSQQQTYVGHGLSSVRATRYWQVVVNFRQQLARTKRFRQSSQAAA
jgi:hypothetical protein